MIELGLPLETRIEFNRAPLMRKEIVTKRVLDLFLAGTALVILSPLLALVCLGIKPHLFNVLSGQMSLVGPAH